MCAALPHATRALSDWVSQNPESYPPIVINVSDGDATDGDLVPLSQQIMGLQTSDGNVLVYNVHLSEVSGRPVQFPDSDDDLPDELATRLFQMSSVLPEGSRKLAETLDMSVGPESRGFVFNADMVSLVQFLDIGTRGPSNVDPPSEMLPQEGLA